MNAAESTENPLSKGLCVLAKIIAADMVHTFNEDKWLQRRMDEVMQDERLVAALQ